MGTVNFLFDHIETDEYINLICEEARNLPLSLSSMAHWKEGRKYFTSRDCVNNYYLLYTVSGSGVIEYRHIKRLLSSGYIALVDCNEPHMYYTSQSDYWETVWFHINGSIVKSYFDLINGAVKKSPKRKRKQPLKDSGFRFLRILANC